MPDSTELRSHGLKVTLPRLHILEIFQKTPVRHLSAEDVYRLLVARGHDVGLATVYRVLAQLHQVGLLKQAHFESEKAVYELNDGEHHDHLVCITCGRVQEFHTDDIERRQQAIAREHGFEVVEHTHVLYGRCTNNQCEHRRRMTSRKGKSMKPDAVNLYADSACTPVVLHPRVSIEQVEEGQELAPKLDEDGLIACVTTDADSGEVLMLGYMNREALEKTIQTGEAHYWSRSRKTLWHKGATSGLVQTVEEMRIDDDQDAVWLRVRVSGSGASCHVGYRSCFYRRIPIGEREANRALAFTEARKTYDPNLVYGDTPNPTVL